MTSIYSQINPLCKLQCVFVVGEKIAELKNKRLNRLNKWDRSIFDKDAFPVSRRSFTRKFILRSSWGRRRLGSRFSDIISGGMRLRPLRKKESLSGSSCGTGRAWIIHVLLSSPIVCSRKVKPSVKFNDIDSEQPAKIDKRSSLFVLTLDSRLYFDKKNNVSLVELTNWWQWFFDSFIKEKQSLN